MMDKYDGLVLLGLLVKQHYGCAAVQGVAVQVEEPEHNYVDTRNPRSDGPEQVQNACLPVPGGPELSLSFS